MEEVVEMCLLWMVYECRKFEERCPLLVISTPGAGDSKNVPLGVNTLKDSQGINRERRGLVQLVTWPPCHFEARFVSFLFFLNPNAIRRIINRLTLVQWRPRTMTTWFNPATQIILQT